jgi:hypothetical protein
MKDSSDAFLDIPNPAASSDELYQFALSFNAYDLLGLDTSSLQNRYSEHEIAFRFQGKIDLNFDVDFYRGFLFYLARTDHFVEGFWDKNIALSRALVTAIRQKSGT